MRRLPLLVALAAAALTLLLSVPPLGTQAQPSLSLSGEPVAATAGAGTITTDGGKLYSWTGTRDRSYVQNASTSPAILLVKINGTACGPTNWDVELQPGQILVPHQDLPVTQYQLYATGAVVYGTDFVVKGWQ